MPLVMLDNSLEVGPIESGLLPAEDYQRQRGEYMLAREDYELNRLYYDGEQYETENDAARDTLGYARRGMRLPEHLRKHSYSSHIGEAIDTLADQLAEGVKYDGTHSERLNAWWTQAQMDQRIDDWLREALMTGDSYAIPEFDPVSEKMRVDLWEADSVWPVYRETDWRTLSHWYRFREVVIDGLPREEERIYMLVPAFVVDDEEAFLDEAFDGEIQVVQQVVEFVYVDREFMVGIPQPRGRFSLVHGVGDTRHRLRSSFGDSMITKKARGDADRYNALSQLGFRIARQNSFSTIAVVGDATSLGAGTRSDEIPKDIADVLRFPGGTEVKTVTLPTDPRMIQFKLQTIERNLYKEFGLTKMDIQDIGGLGTVSGYALEVMNRRDRATHQRVRNNAVGSIRRLAEAMLDVHAYAQAAVDGREWYDVDPDEAYGDRENIDVTVGSGDIVDAVGLRDDYNANLVSRRYVLRKKGLSNDEIEQVEQEMIDEQTMFGAPPPSSNGSPSRSLDGQQVGQLNRTT